MERHFLAVSVEKRCLPTVDRSAWLRTTLVVVSTVVSPLGRCRSILTWAMSNQSISVERWSSTWETRPVCGSVDFDWPWYFPTVNVAVEGFCETIDATDRSDDRMDANEIDSSSTTMCSHRWDGSHTEAQRLLMSFDSLMLHVGENWLKNDGVVVVLVFLLAGSFLVLLVSSDSNGNWDDHWCARALFPGRWSSWFVEETIGMICEDLISWQIEWGDAILHWSIAIEVSVKWITLSNSIRVPDIEKEEKRREVRDKDCIENEQLERDVYQGHPYFLFLHRLFNSICLCFAFHELNSK